MVVPESQKGSASLNPAGSGSVLQAGIGPLDSDRGAGAWCLDLVNKNVTPTNSTQTGETWPPKETKVLSL